jgi:hypothetical protein
MPKRGILAEIPRIEGRDFYPLLAEVGKDYSYPCVSDHGVNPFKINGLIS